VPIGLHERYSHELRGGLNLPNTIYQHQYDNGLTLLAEPMDWLESAAFTMMVSAGCRYDPLELPGLANFSCEMIQRGAGSRSSRQFVEDLELLGVDHSASVSNAHASYGGAMLADNLVESLRIFADLFLCPLLPAEQLEEGRLVCLQELWSVDDDLAQQVMNNIRLCLYPDPLGRSIHGSEASLRTISSEDIGEFFRSTYVPAGATLSVAGRFEWSQLRDVVGELFAGWERRDLPSIVESDEPARSCHTNHDSSQTHIVVAYPSVPYSDPDFFQARGAVGVLSDGMSSRLFTEVREKRGLCYTVFARTHSLRDRGAVVSYAGTSTERAQETMDVLVAELLRLADGIEQSELDRLKARIKSGLIMQQESCRARSAAIAVDWYHLDRVQTLDELGRIIDELSCESINKYLAEHPPGNFATATLGQQELEVPIGIS